MDISYLLLLQQFREATHNILSPFLMWMSDFAIGFWPIAIVCMIFWVFDRKAGRRLLAGYGAGMFMNGLLKLTFRITRPWLRDSRVLPYGDSKVTATGYSFPSGHSTWATSLLGGVALWERKRNRILAVIFGLAVFTVMFSRNYLGVHTPQDVLVGFSATCIMMFLANLIEDWTDKDPKRDIYVLIAGLGLCVAGWLYYNNIHIMEVYDEAGTLVVEPAKMIADSYEGLGFVSSFVICRYFERRYFHFDTEKSWKDRFIICAVALIPLYLWCNYSFALLAPVSRSLARFAYHAVNVAYTMIVVPFAMSKIDVNKIVKEKNR